MKKVYFALLTLTGILALNSFIAPDKRNMASGTIDMPDFQWTSGEVKFHDVADKSAFSLNLTRPEFKAGDKVKITFNLFKVTLRGFAYGTTFDKWSAKVSLVYNDNNKWIPMVSDTNEWINKPFTSSRNNASDSLTNYSFTTSIPKDGHFSITVSPLSFLFDNINGNGKPMFTNGYPTMNTLIKGIKVQKL
jgi:hypothetical protein